MGRKGNKAGVEGCFIKTSISFIVILYHVDNIGEGPVIY